MDNTVFPHLVGEVEKVTEKINPCHQNNLITTDSVKKKQAPSYEL